MNQRHFRRQFLAATTAVTVPLIAGCSGSEDEGSSDGSDGGDGTESTENGSDNGASNEGTDTELEENASDGEGENTSEGSSEEEEDAAANAEQGENILENRGLVIQEHELVEESEFETYVEGIVENTTDEEKSYVEVRVRGYDADGNQLDSYLDNTQNLAAGGTWAFEVLIFDAEELEEYDIQVSDSSLM